MVGRRSAWRQLLPHHTSPPETPPPELKLPELASWDHALDSKILKALPEEEEAMAREAARTPGEGSPGHCGGFLTERQVLEAACLRRKKS